ncbi:hypothetical protein BJX70DRAFT_134590 [Aspergillus crustosus]
MSPKQSPPQPPAPASSLSQSQSPPSQNPSNTTTYFHTHPHPLYTPFLTDPSYTPSRILSLSNAPNPQENEKPHRDPFFTLLLRNPAVISTLFLSRPTPTPTAHLLLHIGPAVNGQEGIAHGGFLATVLDEVCGTLISATRLDEGRGIFTASLAVGYRRAVFVPEVEDTSSQSREGGGSGKEEGGQDQDQEGKGTVIMATARLGRVEGRKVFVEGEIRDAAGEVCTTVEAIFVKKRVAGL